LKKKAKAEAKRDIATKMLAKNYPLDEIVSLTGLRKSVVEKMVREMNGR
jgi:hypothetical protein